MRKFSRNFLLSIGIVALCSMTCYADDNKEITLTVLETSDMHGSLMNYDYAQGQEVKNGLVKCATVIKKEREKDPNLLLLDCGDTTQGNMVSDFRRDPVPPAMAALNYLNYDAWELGNHEFNFEFSSLMNNIKNFRGVTLGGNIFKKDGTRFAQPYIVRDIKGIKVAVFGVDAPHIPVWESDPSHYNNMTFTTPMVEIGKIIKELQEQKPDVIIGLCHYGENGEKGEHGMYDVAKAYGSDVDAFLIGHAHSTLLRYLNNGKWEEAPDAENSTCIMETGSNAKNVGKLTLKVQKGDKGWKVTSRHIELLSCADAEPDAGLVEVLKDVHAKSLAASNRVIGEVSADFYDDPVMLPHIPKAVIEPGPLTALINKVMMENAGADVSMCGVFSENTNIKKGPFRYKDACSVYRYDNTLIAVKVTGAQLKSIMEKHCGAFFNAYKPGDVTISFNSDMNLYDYDTFNGVSYEIDLSKPVGKRIANLTYKGKPLTVDQEIVLACSNYRYGQMVQENLISPDDLVFNSVDLPENSTVREMISKYISSKKTISPTFERNWKIVGVNLDCPEAETVYRMVREGKIEIPSSSKRRTPNCRSLNINELREQGLLPALETK